ncbi:hypothetical protein FHX82_000509 [Amycolatopsis bartoniae]|uniref:Uncharacterized protein n=1 Tax=Amycolatopsis bartoniae TaxID=941986 RepID=A0A8H9IVT2_9PSEU|nr:hypothetical protein [Amycolatopsis bartoniae]MBB2933489.1 hypothetical protein [Amycolatopsis bartoniae]TVT07592.1 hypothetical protein FNH07_15600 [Amycolatopsis bartoniae]GHF59848.1 hypothetical protein GCM10017566_36780 [Amycolatopsis bartoniae]
MTRIRLGWETRSDQIAVLVDFLIVGLGLVLLGSLSGWTGWITVPMIIVGVVFLLGMGLRMLGWDSLRWPRDLVVSGDYVGYETKTFDSAMGKAFRISWDKLGALAYHSDSDAPERYGAALVFFPKSKDFPDHVTSPVLVRLHRNSAVKFRLPRAAGVAEAISAEAPQDWQRIPSGHWDALVAAPGVSPQVIPEPDPRPPVVVNVNRRAVGQVLVGGVIAGCVGAAMIAAAFTSKQVEVGMQVFLTLFGAPFILLAVVSVLGLPMVGRKRNFVIDADSFTWDDPSGEGFTYSWHDITSVAAHTSISRKAPGSWAARRRIDEVLVHTRERNETVSLGTQPATVARVAQAVQQFAPQLWAGARTGTAGPFQLR